MNEQALTEQKPFGSLADPETIVNDAVVAATKIKQLIDKTGRKLVLNSKEYLFVESWQTIGRFYGLSAEVEWTKAVEEDGSTGVKARAAVKRHPDGLELSAGEAVCMRSEANWKDKPYFQLESMAQTRAVSKAFRNIVAWVAVLAGFHPTPAEEMEPESPQEPRKQAPPTNKSEWGKFTADRAGKCAGCGGGINVGDTVHWNRATKKRYCSSCASGSS